jgi:hypothetical protein
MYVRFEAKRKQSQASDAFAAFNTHVVADSAQNDLVPFPQYRFFVGTLQV